MQLVCPRVTAGSSHGNARAHSNAAVDHLNKLGANLVVMGESEIADRMLERAQGKS